MGRGRTLSRFQKEFPDEESCAAYLAAQRWPEGFVCPGCGGSRAWSLASRCRLLECPDCGRQTSVTAGTILHRSKLPLQTWFWATHLLATHSNGMSALQLSDQLGVTYKTAWLLAQKLRRAMIDPDRFASGRRGRSRPSRDSIPNEGSVLRSRQGREDRYCGRRGSH